MAAWYVLCGVKGAWREMRDDQGVYILLQSWLPPALSLPAPVVGQINRFLDRGPNRSSLEALCAWVVSPCIGTLHPHVFVNRDFLIVVADDGTPLRVLEWMLWIYLV